MKADLTLKNLFGKRFIWALVGLTTLLVFNLFFTNNFFRIEIREGHLYGTLLDILNQGAKVMLLAIGMTLVIATGGVDLSVGSIMAIAGAIAALLVKNTPTPFVFVLFLSLGAASIAGLWNGVLVGYARIQPIVATLIMMVAGRGIAQLLSKGQIVTFSQNTFLYIGNGHLLGLPFTVFIVAFIFAAVWLATRKTAIGFFIESVGDNETASRFTGINSRRIRLLAYACSGICAGIAGLIATSNVRAADSSRVGEMMELDAIFAVVVGGTALTGGRFTLAGSIIGAVLIQTLTTTMYNLGVPPAIAPVPKAVVIVCVCLLQSEIFRREVMRVFGKGKAR